eukprot:7569361-Pyramimonas_sp.AAC.1
MFPWSWCRLLSDNPAIRNACVEEAKLAWQLILKLEGSTNPVETELSKILFFRKGTVFREPLNLLQANNYVPCPRLYEYVAAMHEHLGSSLSLEARAFL